MNRVTSRYGCWLLALTGCGGVSALAPAPAPVTVAPAGVASAAATEPPAADSESGRSTPGQIACGGASCAVGSQFCFEQSGHPPQCLSLTERPARGMSGGDMDALYLCDDAADCAAGERCCAGSWGGTGPGYHECTAARCDDHEDCVPGGACPSGLRCATAAGSPERAACLPASPGVACGASRCAGDTPACCQNSATGAHRCLPAGSDPRVCSGDDEALLECKNQRDCGGYLCCVSLIGSTWCSSNCPGAAAAVACDSFADCPPEGPGPGGMRQRYSRCEGGLCAGDLCSPGGTWRPCDEL